MKKFCFIASLILLFLIIGLNLFKNFPLYNRYYKLTILYTQNIEESILVKKNSFNDLPLLSFALKKIKKEIANNNGSLIIADLGNSMYKNNEENFLKSEIAVRIMNYLKYDILIPGSKEFKYGTEILKLRTYQSNFKYITTNISCINFSKTFPNFYNYNIIDKNNTKIGIMGLTDPKIPKYLSNTKISNLEFKNSIRALKNTSNILKNKNTDINILFCNENINKNKKFNKYAQLIIYPKKYSDLKEHINLFRVDIIYDKKNNKVIKVSENTIKISAKNYKIDNELKNILNIYIENSKKWMNEIIGKCNLKIESNNFNECSAGDLVSDIIKKSGNCDIGIINSDSLINSIPSGNIKNKNIVSFIKQGLSIVAIKLTGYQLKNIINSIKNRNDNYILFCSGLTYTIEKKKNKIFDISNIKVNNKNIELNKYYTIATTNFLANGNNNWNEFTKWNSLVYRSSLRKEITDYFKMYSPINYKISNKRIKIIEN